jgi:hypothetical protein
MPAKSSKVKEVSNSSSSSTSNVDNGDSTRILLTKAINNLSVNRDSFAESVKTFQNLTKEMVDNLDLQIEDRSKQLNESKTMIENELKDAKIKASQKLAEHKREIAVNFLAESGEVPINEGELENLREEHETAISNHQTELNNLRDELTKKAKDDLQSAVACQELRHKAVFAETQAENKMLKTEISNLHDYITKLKEEVNEQRKLSATIAQANSKESIHQTFGK